MPLGKISKKQIHEAFTILKNLQMVFIGYINNNSYNELYNENIDR